MTKARFQLTNRKSKVMGRFRRLLCISSLLLTACANASAQDGTDMVKRDPVKNYSIRADVELQYTEDLFSPPTGDSSYVKMNFSSPLFIEYNKGDLQNFLKFPEAFLYDADPLMTTSYTFTALHGSGEINPGMMQVDELSISKNQAGIFKRDIQGEIESALTIDFSILNVKEMMEKGDKPLFTLLFSVPDCSGCWQKVNDGYAQVQNEFGKYVTGKEALQMVLGFSHENFYVSDEIQAVYKAGLVEAEPVIKDVFIEKFRKNYYKNAPKTDAEQLIRFLLNPSGKLEIPFEGSIRSDNHFRRNARYEGRIRVHGDQNYRFMPEGEKQD